MRQKTVTEVRRKIEQAKRKLRTKPFVENFGQKEVRKIQDFAGDLMDYDYLIRLEISGMIDGFSDWCMNYTPTKNNRRNPSVEIEDLKVSGHSVEKMYDIDNMRKIIKLRALEWENNLEDIESDLSEGQYEFIVETLASDSQGIYAVQKALDYFGLEFPEGLEKLVRRDFGDYRGYPFPEDEEPNWVHYEWAHSVLEEYADKIANKLDEELSIPGKIYFGWSNGGYYMLYSFDEDDFEELKRLSKRNPCHSRRNITEEDIRRHCGVGRVNSVENPYWQLQAYYDRRTKNIDDELEAMVGKIADSSEYIIWSRFLNWYGLQKFEAERLKKLIETHFRNVKVAIYEQ